MRVLIVDQDSAMLEAIARSLRESYTVDAVTNKGDCLDLLKQNEFEVIVACERLEDGSGLELLGQVAKRWPSVLRIFAADRHRLKLLKGRLGPFELFQTLAYPIDPDRLLSVLLLADAAQAAEADTSNIQHVVLASEAEEAEEPNPFPPPQPEPRAEPVEAPVELRPRNNVRSLPARLEASAKSGSPGGGSNRRSRSSRSAVAVRQEESVDPVPPVTRPRSPASKRPPVRFPPLDTPSPSPAARARFSSTPQADIIDSLSEAADAARQARSSLDSFPEEIAAKRTTLLIGSGAALALVVVFLGVKLFSSKSPATAAAPVPVVHAPQYPAEVTSLLAQIETALQQDDYKSARAGVDKLRLIAPSHPRLPFFESLLAKRTDVSKPSGAAPARVVQAKHKKFTPALEPPVAASSSGGQPPPLASAGTHQANKPSTDGPALPPETPVGITLSSSAAKEPTQGSSAAGPQTQVTMEQVPEPVTPPQEVTSPSVTSPSVTSPSVTSPSVTSPSATSSSATSPPATSPPPESLPVAAKPVPPSRRASSDEPPPVVREPKLIHKVSPSYPSAAKHDGIEGFVELDVTISRDGAVTNASVSHAEPSGVFDQSALTAVRRYKYEPRYEDGLPVEAHVTVRLDFKASQ